MFLQWIPWMLRMGRPGEKITRKTIMMQNKMKELDLKERSSKSLLANVLDMDDDFRCGGEEGARPDKRQSEQLAPRGTVSKFITLASLIPWGVPFWGGERLC